MRPETTRLDDRDELANCLVACDRPGVALGTDATAVIGDPACSWPDSGGIHR